jgi:hypothetical protein
MLPYWFPVFTALKAIIMSARVENEYEIKFKAGGAWMETNDFLTLIKELHDRFGIDAKVTPSVDGIRFYIHEGAEQ